MAKTRPKTKPRSPNPAPPVAAKPVVVPPPMPAAPPVEEPPPQVVSTRVAPAPEREQDTDRQREQNADPSDDEGQHQATPFRRRDRLEAKAAVQQLDELAVTVSFTLLTMQAAYN